MIISFFKKDIASFDIFVVFLKSLGSLLFITWGCSIYGKAGIIEKIATTLVSDHPHNSKW